MTKDVMDAIRERRSIRRFKADPVPEATLGRLLESAVQAPSAGNLQPWFFYVVKKAEIREELARAAGYQKFVAEAPVTIVVCADVPRSARYYGRRGAELYCLQDTAAAIQNLMLAATAFGLGTCWVGAFSEEMTRNVLQLPDHLRPVALIPVGYPVRQPAPRPRRPLEEVVKLVD